MPKANDDSEDFLDTSPERMARAHNNRLRLFFERVELMEEEKKAIADDINDVFAEAKATGYDTKIMRFVLRLRKMESSNLQEWDAMVEAYRAEVGL